MVNPIAVDQTKIVTKPSGKFFYIDADGDGRDLGVRDLTYAIVTPPNKGLAALAGESTYPYLTYVPDVNATGTDTLVYSVTDQNGNSNTGTLTLSINHRPTTVDDHVIVSATGSVIIRPLENDSDPDGDPISLSGIPTASLGTLRFNGTDEYTYTPLPGSTGFEHITYHVTDGVDPGYSSSSGRMIITIDNLTATNAAPVALNDETSVHRERSTTINIGSNDSDPDGDDLTTTGLTNPNKGTVTYNDNEDLPDKVTYSPLPGAAGTDSFTYQVTDPSGLTSTATVAITFENSAPIANDDIATVRIGDTIQINVGLNDSDADEDPLTTSLITNPSQGTASVTENTNFYDFITYTPNLDALGIDSFTYQISDGKGATNTASIDIVILEQTREITVTGPEVYRFFNTQSGNHFYSRDEVEANSILTNLPHFRLEGPAFKAADPSNGPTADVFRFFNTGNGAHLFTQDTDERDFVIANLDHFNFEGVAYQGHPDPVEGSLPLYRFLNTQTGSHFYTTNENEKNNIIATASDLYNFENIAYHVYRPTDIEFAPVQSDPIPLLGVSPVFDTGGEGF